MCSQGVVCGGIASVMLLLAISPGITVYCATLDIWIAVSIVLWWLASVIPQRYAVNSARPGREQL